MILSLIGSFMGLSKTLRMAVYAGIAMVMLSAVVGWLRWDAAMDERRNAVARSNAEVIEVLKERNEIERRMDNATDSDLRDILGIPH